MTDIICAWVVISQMLTLWLGLHIDAPRELKLKVVQNLFIIHSTVSCRRWIFNMFLGGIVVGDKPLSSHDGLLVGSIIEIVNPKSMSLSKIDCSAWY